MEPYFEEEPEDVETLAELPVKFEAIVRGYFFMSNSFSAEVIGTLVGFERRSDADSEMAVRRRGFGERRGGQIRGVLRQTEWEVFSVDIRGGFRR